MADAPAVTPIKAEGDDKYRRTGEPETPDAGALDAIRKGLAQPNDATTTPRAGDATTAARPWTEDFKDAVRNIDALNQIGDRTGLVSDAKGNTFDATALRQRLIESTDRSFQSAIRGSQADATGSSGRIFGALSQVDGYGQRMAALRQDLAPQLKALGLDKPNLTSEEIRGAIINNALGTNEEALKDVTKAKLTEYLTLNEMQAVATKQAGAAQEANKGPMMATLAYASFLNKFAGGGAYLRDEAGNPTKQVVTAAGLVRQIADADLGKIAPPGQATTPPGAGDRPVPFKGMVPDADNPYVTLSQITDPKGKDLAPFQKALQQANGDAFDPTKITAQITDLTQQIKDGKVPDNDETKARIAALQAMTHVRAEMEGHLGMAMVRQDKADYVGALDHLRKAVADPAVRDGMKGPDGQPVLPGLLEQVEKLAPQQVAVAAHERFVKEHPEFKAIDGVTADPKFRTAVNAVLEGWTKAGELLKPNGKEPPSEENIKKAREALQGSYENSKVVSEMLKPHADAINNLFSTLSKRENKTPEQQAELAEAARMYQALHMQTEAATRLGKLMVRSGDPLKGKDYLEEAGRDQRVIADDPKFADQLDQEKKIADAVAYENAPWYAKYGKYIGAGVAVVGAVAATYFTGGLAAPTLGWASAYAGGVLASAGAGTLIGGELEYQGGLTRNRWDGYKDSFQASFAGATIGAFGASFALPRVAAAVAPEAAVAGEAAQAAAAAQKGWFATQAARIPYVAQTTEALGAMPKSQFFANIGANSAWARPLVGETLAPHVAMMSSRMLYTGSAAAISGLPQLLSDRPTNYLNWVGAGTFAGALGPTGAATGRLASTGLLLGRTGVFIGGDALTNMGSETISPHNNGATYWSNVWAGTMGDVQGTAMTYFLPAGRLLAPGSAALQRDGSFAQAEQEARRLRDVAARRAQVRPQEPPK